MVDVSLDDQDDPRRPTTIRISPGANRENSNIGIPAGTEVTVTFNKAAGISNPTEGGAFSWEVATSKITQPVNPGPNTRTKKCGKPLARL